MPEFPGQYEVGAVSTDFRHSFILCLLPRTPRTLKGIRFIWGICSFLRSRVRVFPIRLMLKLLCHLSPRHLLEKTSQNILEYLYSTEAGLGEEPGLSYP